MLKTTTGEMGYLRFTWKMIIKMEVMVEGDFPDCQPLPLTN